MTPVLLISHHAEVVGGGELSLLGLLDTLDRARWAPILVVPAEGRVAADARALGVPVHVVPMPSLRRPGPGVLRSVAALARLTRQRGAVLLHANGSRAMFYAGLAARLTGRPAIWHVRVADGDGLFDRLLARLASAVVVNSQAVARRVAWLPAGKVRCIHNGVDLARFAPRPPSPALRQSLGLPAAAPVVLSVGRFVPFKGYTHLLAAAALVREQRPDVHFVLVGDGELRGELEAQARGLALEAALHFTGWRDDVPELMALADVFVLPSLGEHFGRVLIEAMAMEKAVVATDGGGVPEVVTADESGLLVPPGQPAALARAVVALLRDPGWSARLAAAARRRAESEFDRVRHAAAVERLYRELAPAVPARA